MAKGASRKNKIIGYLNLSGKGPSILPPPKRQRTRHVKNFQARSDFKLISWLSPEDQKELDSLRDSLQASIERTVRIQLRFVQELNKHAVGCNRTKSIVKALDIVPFHSDCQRKVVNEGIYDILKSQEREAKRLAEEAKKKRHEEHKSNCFSCYACEHY
jgi:hypothetical protein